MIARAGASGSNVKSSDHDDTQLLALVEGFRLDQGPLFNERWTHGQAYRQAIRLSGSLLPRFWAKWTF
jgi:hypothetical protein